MEYRRILRQLDLTYATELYRPKAELYTAYCLLSQTLGRTSKEEVYEADLSALEALGARFSLDRPAKLTASLRTGQAIFDKDPVISLQDAIISCLKIAHDCLVAQNRSLAR